MVAWNIFQKIKVWLLLSRLITPAPANTGEPLEQSGELLEKCFNSVKIVKNYHIPEQVQYGPGWTVVILDQGREYGELSLALRHLQEHSLGLPYAGVEGSHVWEEQQRFWPFKIIHRIDAPDLHTLRGESDQVYMLSYAVQVMLANLVQHCKVVDC